MKILIAGGSGFIGSHLSRRLLNDGNEIICVDNLLTGSKKNIEDLLSNKSYQFVNHDVTKSLPDDITAEAVFHMASPASPNHHSIISYHSLPMETMMVNTLGTLELLNFAKKNNAKFLFASTSEIYGDPLEHPQKEEYRGNVSTIGPRAVYDEAKRFGETLTSHFWRNGVDSRIARIFNTYGPGMHKDDFRMVANFVTQAVKNEPITVFGDGKQTRSLCYIDDLVEGLVRLMFNDKTKGEVVNLGNPEEHTVLEYAELIKKIANSQSQIVHTESLPQDDPLRRQPDISKARQLLSWEPKVPLSEGLSRMVEYIKGML